MGPGFARHMDSLDLPWRDAEEFRNRHISGAVLSAVVKAFKGA